MDYKKLKTGELKNEIKKRNLGIPKKGSGKSGRVLRKDLIEVLSSSSLYTKSQFNKLKRSELVDKIKKTSIVWYSNFLDTATKKELVDILYNYYHKYEQPTEISSKLFDDMSYDMKRVIIKKLPIRDILSFCSTNKEGEKLCNELFFQILAKDKLKIDKLGRYDSWKSLIYDMKYGIHDIYTIFQLYNDGIIKDIPNLTRTKKYLGVHMYDIYDLIADDLIDLYDVADIVNHEIEVSIWGIPKTHNIYVEATGVDSVIYNLVTFEEEVAPLFRKHRFLIYSEDIWNPDTPGSYISDSITLILDDEYGVRI